MTKIFKIIILILFSSFIYVVFVKFLFSFSATQNAAELCKRGGSVTMATTVDGHTTTFSCSANSPPTTTIPAP